MKVVLMQDINKLGKLGDEVNVKDGYARNYLLPKSLAIKSTKSVINILKRKKYEIERKNKKSKEVNEIIVEKLKDFSCTISMEASEEGNLFGSVTVDTIYKYLSHEGIEVDKKCIILEKPIKSLGIYNIDIKLGFDINTQVKIWVVKK